MGMTRAIKFSVIIVIVAVVVYFALSSPLLNFSPQQNTPPTSELSQPAPVFTVSDINGTKVSLSDFKGKIVILYFMGTIYDAQIDELQALWPKYRGKGVVLIGLVSPACECTQSQIYEVREQRKITWFVVRDDAYITFTHYAKFIAGHGEPYLPTVILIDQNLGITSVYGFVPASTLSLEIDALMSK